MTCKGMPRCPKDCGGPYAPLHRLSTSRLECRSANGCDGPLPEAVYDITCVRCDGLYDDCDLCDGSGRNKVYRCPGSHQSRDVSRAMRAYGWMQRGVMPAPGSYSDQSPSFLAFVHAIEDEINVIRASEERNKQSLHSAMARAKGTG